MEKITVSVTVATDVSKAWEYWTNPDHITKWNFASDDWECPWATNDPVTGGKFSARMQAKDGSFGFDFEGIYSEVIPMQKIAYAMEDGRQVEIVFESVDGGTKVTETFDPETENPREMQQDGWQSIMNNYKKHVESN